MIHDSIDTNINNNIINYWHENLVNFNQLKTMKTLFSIQMNG